MKKNGINLPAIAWRNLSRHKTKTIITVLSVVICVWLFNFVDAWIYGMRIDSQRNLVNFETGAAKIYSKPYFEKKDELPTYEGFKNYDEVVEKLESSKYDVSPQFVFTGSLLSIEQEIPFKLIALDPEMADDMYLYADYIEEGRMIKPGNFEIMLGTRGAQDLSVKIGDQIRVSTTIDRKTKDENGKEKIIHTNQVFELTVVGILNTVNPIVNGKMGFIPIDMMQDELGMDLNGTVTEIAIRSKDASPSDLPKKKESEEVINNLLDGTLPDNLIVVDWREDAKDFLAMSAGDAVSMYIILAFLVLLSFIGINNTMLMAVLERTKEIGMIRAQGVLDSEIKILFVIEAGLIGLIGAIIGTILGLITNYFMVKYGVDMTNMVNEMGGNVGYRVIGVFKSAWNTKSMIIALFATVLLSAWTALSPVKRALKKSIVDALRFE